MRKNSCWLILVFWILTIHNAYSQKEDYIVSDSTLITGIKLITGSRSDNAKIVRFVRENEIKEYYPDQIIEYGIKNGTRYLSKSIPIDGEEKKVFLELLVEGKLSLYYYEKDDLKTFYLESDSLNLVELNPDLQAFTSSTTDCKYSADAAKVATYKRNSLSKLVEYYNQCRKQPLPYTKIGVAIGRSTTSLSRSSNYRNDAIQAITFDPVSSLSIGVFGDFPIEMTHFALNSGFFFTKTGFVENSTTSTSDTDAVVNITSVKLPVMIKYLVPTFKIRPFFELGTQFVFNTHNESSIHHSTIYNNYILVDQPYQEKLVADNLIGYVLGLGLQYNVYNKQTISFEMRNSSSYGSSDFFNLKGIDLLIGLTF